MAYAFLYLCLLFCSVTGLLFPVRQNNASRASRKKQPRKLDALVLILCALQVMEIKTARSIYTLTDNNNEESPDTYQCLYFISKQLIYCGIRVVSIRYRWSKKWIFSETLFACCYRYWALDEGSFHSLSSSILSFCICSRTTKNMMSCVTE